MTKEKLAKLVLKTGGREFGVNEWGSCQYTTAINMFDTLEATFDKFNKRDTPAVAREKTLKKLMIKVTDDGVEDTEMAWKKFKKELTKAMRGVDDKEWVAKFKKELKEATPSVDAMFEIARHQSWDLWSAAPFIAGLMFRNLQVEQLPEAPGVGPAWNLIVQGENFSTGLHCWLLWSYGLVKDQKSFAEFDT